MCVCFLVLIFLVKSMSPQQQQDKPSLSHWSAVNHYNAHALPSGSRASVLRRRANGPLFELKKFHNAIKRNLITQYCTNAPEYLDIGCGRGGDIQKLCDAKVGRVTGIDISPLEIAEAHRRLRETRSHQTQFRFSCASALQWNPPPDTPAFDAIGCMFCIHYFFRDESTAAESIQKIASLLRPNGVFIGCVPDAEALTKFHSDGKVSKYLTLTAMWHESSSRPYGGSYIFDLHDTVTAKTSSSRGSVEYLVHFDVLASLAQKNGLHLVDSSIFQPPDDMPGSEVSQLFRWFVFKKT